MNTENREKREWAVGGLALLAGLLAVAATLWMPGTLPASANTASAVRYVAPGGNCGGASPCYASIQDAVDASSDGDEIRIAAGTYTGASAESGKTALVHLQQQDINLTLRGGYTTSDWEHPDPTAHPAVLDAQNQGVVVFIRCVGCGSDVTLDGLHITGGYASESTTGVEAGGGIHVESTSYMRVFIQNCEIYSNTAEDGEAGGVYYESSDDARIENNVVRDNTGQGIALSFSDSPEILNNTVTGNSGDGVYVSSGLGRVEVRGNTITANGRGVWLSSLLNGIVEGNTILSNTVGADQWMTAGGGVMGRSLTLSLRDNLIRGNVSPEGGGIWLDGTSDTLIEDNRIEGNHATVSYNSAGGGLYVNTGDGGDVTIRNNTVLSNTANGDGGGIYALSGHVQDVLVQNNLLRGNDSGRNGGGLYINTGTVEDNTIRENTARRGGGVYAHVWEGLRLKRNTFEDNQAGEDGGGLYAYIGPPVHLEANRFLCNRAGNNGGGLYSFYQAPSLFGHISLTNTLLAENHAIHGSGLYFYGGQATLKHTTIANNGGESSDGIGLYVKPFSVVSVTLTNTVVASQTMGVYAEGGDVALIATLWGDGAWDNGDDWGGGGHIVTGTLNYWGDPLFVAAGDYHLTASSPARDTGIDAGVPDDVDGEARPHPDTGIPDLGADEYHLDDIRIYLPLVVKH